MSFEKYDKNELENLLSDRNNTYTKIGKMYGVSASSIKKAARKFGIKLPDVRPIYDNLVYKSSDDEFTDIIKSSLSWKEIGTRLGYKSKVLSSNVKDAIRKRCNELGIELVVIKINKISNIKKGDLFGYRKNWNSARGAIAKFAKDVYFKQHGHVCEVCGYDKHIEVAHIKSVSSFDDNATIQEINDINNLIGLCPNHHWEYDNGLLDITQYKTLRGGAVAARQAQY